MSNVVAVIDYGMGNLHSVASALQHVDPSVTVHVTADPVLIAQADRVIFPGVGAIRDCMSEIRRLHIDRVVDDVQRSGKPLLAICVGMQALLQRSQENAGVECLGYFDGEVQGFEQHPSFASLNDKSGPSQERLKVPHMGWNRVTQVSPHPLWEAIPDHSYFYFVHSFYVSTTELDAVVGRCHYGIDFHAALRKDNVFSVQFHPEKSHINGLQLLRNFLTWDGSS